MMKTQFQGSPIDGAAAIHANPQLHATTRSPSSPEGNSISGPSAPLVINDSPFPDPYQMFCSKNLVDVLRLFANANDIQRSLDVATSIVMDHPACIGCAEDGLSDLAEAMEKVLGDVKLAIERHKNSGEKRVCGSDGLDSRAQSLFLTAPPGSSPTGAVASDLPGPQSPATPSPMIPAAQSPNSLMAQMISGMMPGMMPFYPPSAGEVYSPFMPQFPSFNAHNASGYRDLSSYLGVPGISPLYPMDATAYEPPSMPPPSVTPTGTAKMTDSPTSDTRGATASSPQPSPWVGEDSSSGSPSKAPYLNLNAPRFQPSFASPVKSINKEYTGFVDFAEIPAGSPVQLPHISTSDLQSLLRRYQNGELTPLETKRALHELGSCKPCAFFHFPKKLCNNVRGCHFCHHEEHRRYSMKCWKRRRQRITKDIGSKDLELVNLLTNDTSLIRTESPDFYREADYIMACRSLKLSLEGIFPTSIKPLHQWFLKPEVIEMVEQGKRDVESLSMEDLLGDPELPLGHPPSEPMGPHQSAAQSATSSPVTNWPLPRRIERNKNE